MIRSYLCKWQFWLVVSVVIIVISWILSRGRDLSSYIRASQKIINNGNIESRDNKSHNRETQYDYCEKRYDREYSNRDATPSTEIVNREKLPVYDLTPQIPYGMCTINTHPKRESKGEAISRDVLESIYGVPFPRVRPNWLVNPETGRNMELDGYNDDLKIAFEYNGIQHYKSDHHFNKSYEHFLAQVRRDNLKVDICDSLGVYLITIPYNVPNDQIHAYIKYYLPEAVTARNARMSHMKQ